MHSGYRPAEGSTRDVTVGDRGPRHASALRAKKVVVKGMTNQKWGSAMKRSWARIIIESFDYFVTGACEGEA